MLVRIGQFLLGALLAGGGGYLAWTHRAGALTVFPPGAEGMPWFVIAGVLAIAGGVTLLVNAVHPRPNQKARLAAEAAHRSDVLGAADTYYSERARAADRDWRSGNIPAPATPAPAPASEPLREPVRAAPPQPPAPPPPPAAAKPVVPPPPPPAAPVAPSSASPSAIAKPVATSIPPAAAEATPFPSDATLAPIPRAAEPPPPLAVAPAAAAATPPADPAPSAFAGALFPEIRTAIAQGHLDEADKMLHAERDRAQGLALAELTGLAGDHAAAAGRSNHAKWLWRRALSRFGELNAMDAPAARVVVEKLRTAE